MTCVATDAGRPSRRPTAVALGLTLAVLLLAIADRPLFITNDDAAISMLGAGFGIAAQPEAHLVLAHYGYGLLLGWLSPILGPAAHGWLTLAGLTLCLFVIARELLWVRRTTVSAMLMVTIIGCVYVDPFSEPQFTVTSAGVRLSSRSPLRRSGAGSHRGSRRWPWRPAGSAPRRAPCS